jgi:hypothetical protein
MRYLKGLLGGLVLALSFSSYSSDGISPPVINHSMGDDGSVNVPLQFSFPYYGQNFNDSWMYDNGIISFRPPGSPGSIAPWDWQGKPFNQIGQGYFIAPLWTDLYPVQGTSSYTTQGDETFQRYSWNNLAEYYSVWGGSGLRLNTFNVTLRPDGSINVTYTNVNITQSNVSVGMVGDPQKGEYEQIYYGYGASSIQNWERYTTGVDPCVTDPLSSPICDGYQQAYLNLQCSANPLFDTSCLGYQQAYLTQQCTTNPLYDRECPGYAVAFSTQLAQQIVTQEEVIVQSTPQVTESEQESNNELVTQIEIKTVETAEKEEQEKKEVNPNALSVARNAILQAEQIAMSVSQESSSQSYNENSNPTDILDSDIHSILNRTNSVNENNNETLGSGISIPLVVLAIAEKETTIELIPSLALITQTLLSNEQHNKDNETETLSNTQALDSLIIDLTEQSTLNQNTETREGRSTVRRKESQNDAAGGVSIENLTNSQPSIDLYTQATLKDAQFYQPKDIYKNQRNVDNERILRSLNSRSDRLHQEMVNEQYKR